MSLLRLEQVSMRYASGTHERVALRDVTLALQAGELVAVSGQHRSGRTTLLRIAAGVAAPTTGVACFGGVSLARRSMLGVSDGISYAAPHFEPIVGGTVLQQVAAPLLGRGHSIRRARTIAHRMLMRADVAACAMLTTAELDGAETIRVAIARALVTEPSLVLVDEPTFGVGSARDREELLDLLRSIARREAIAVMLTTDEASGVADADRALVLERGTLRALTRRARPAAGCATRSRRESPRRPRR